jgi:undecaprenyl-diphosphatase
VSLIISTILVQLLKRRIIRVRPFEVLENLHIKKIQIDPYSFPSGHTAASFSLAISATLLFSTLGLIFLSLAVTVGISRMYLGVHYPSDVAVAVIIAALSAFTANLLTNNTTFLAAFML